MMRPRPAVEVRRAALAVALLPRLVLPGPEVVELVDAADARDQRRALGPGCRANGAVVAQATRDAMICAIRASSDASDARRDEQLS